ncbi:hypothetical protein [Parendozoicomonas sp. Alg238-R29]|uniref:hypothetical protein n=1 Tax=Parendozoicomonas sp. Alg238-R29 TaxID=2993446 RepID=UPI00248E1505|nr:hypothetical protein [Parendozoicomonas sp. Alg238-R29]
MMTFINDHHGEPRELPLEGLVIAGGIDDETSSVQRALSNLPGSKEVETLKSIDGAKNVHHSRIIFSGGHTISVDEIGGNDLDQEDSQVIPALTHSLKRGSQITLCLNARSRFSKADLQLFKALKSTADNQGITHLYKRVNFCLLYANERFPAPGDTTDPDAYLTDAISDYENTIAQYAQKHLGIDTATAKQHWGDSWVVAAGRGSNEPGGAVKPGWEYKLFRKVD